MLPPMPARAACRRLDGVRQLVRVHRCTAAPWSATRPSRRQSHDASGGSRALHRASGSRLVRPPLAVSGWRCRLVQCSQTHCMQSMQNCQGKLPMSLAYCSYALPDSTIWRLTPEEVGRRLKQLRESRRTQDGRKLSLGVLGGIVGTDGSHLSRIERGEVPDPGYRLISRIAVFYGFNGADEMLGGPLETQESLQAIYDRRYGIKPLAERIEGAIDLVEQAAPPSAKRHAISEQEPPEPPVEGHEALPHKANPGQHRRGK